MFVRSIVLVLSLFFALQWSQPVAVAQPVNQESSDQTTGTRTKLATIIFAGLGGAILGLSTLSFYGRPQDKLNNISIGFAVGVIIGTVYTTYQTATQSQYQYEEVLVPQIESENLQITQRFESQPNYSVGYTWTF